MSRAAQGVVGALLLATAGGTQAQFNLQPDATGARKGPPALFGTWGTARQCRAHAAGQHDDFTRLPYRIDGQWLRQGMFWCRLSWLGYRGDGASLRAEALAQCGEDGLRDYRLQFIVEDARLRMRWSRDYLSAVLQRC